MPEVNELFSGWDEYPPTNILVKALVEGFGGKKKSTVDETVEMPQEAFDAMQKSAMAEIAVKAGPRLPILQGKDRGLPKTPPVFDIEVMRQRNAEVLARRQNRV